MTYNYRNAELLADGRIDCEIEHSQFGWIPTTLAADDDLAVAILTAADYTPQTDEATLGAAKARKAIELDAACASAILAGFTSTALGEAYHYPASYTDQMNLTASVTASLLPELADDWTTPFWCADASGVWALREHTAAQVQTVGQVGKAAIVAHQQTKQTLSATLAAATTLGEVAAIVWP